MGSCDRARFNELSSFILGNDPRTFEADHVGAMTRRPRMYVFHSLRHRTSTILSDLRACIRLENTG